MKLAIYTQLLNDNGKPCNTLYDFKIALFFQFPPAVTKCSGMDNSGTSRVVGFLYYYM